MKFKTELTKEELNQKAKQMLEGAEDKTAAIYEVIEMLQTAKHQDLIKELTEANEGFENDRETRQRLGLRALNTIEKLFYDKIIANQSHTLEQGDIFPNTMIDHTLDEVRTYSDVVKLIDFAPAGVRKWLTASKTGTALWGGLTDALTAELEATITSMNIEVNKLHAILIIPKAIRELALPLVDKYFRAILAEAMINGIVDGYLNGDGKTGPIGIMRQIGVSNADGTQKAKTVVNSLTDFGLKNMGTVKKYLSNGGKRAVKKIYLLANPSDMAEYVEPALYYFNGAGYACTCRTPIELIEEVRVPSGKAILTIEKAYTMGLSAVKVDEYKETKAIDDCDVLIAKALGNGRATDDNTAYVVDATKLTEFKLQVNTGIEQVVVPTPEA